MAAEVVCSINQPCYCAWLGYYDRIQRSNVHIVLDHVQFEKGSYTNRVRIWENSPRGWQWLTVPVAKGEPIYKTPTIGYKWKLRHVRQLKQTYGITPPFLDSQRPQHGGMSFSYPRLGVLLRRSNEWMFDLLKITTPIKYSYRFLPGDRRKSELVLWLCQRVGATKYLSGPHGRDYLDIRAFEDADIEVVYHDFPRQTIVLSALDSLFNPRSSKEWPVPVLTSAHEGG